VLSVSGGFTFGGDDCGDFGAGGASSACSCGSSDISPSGFSGGDGVVVTMQEAPIVLANQVTSHWSPQVVASRIARGSLVAQEARDSTARAVKERRPVGRRSLEDRRCERGMAPRHKRCQRGRVGKRARRTREGVRAYVWERLKPTAGGKVGSQGEGTDENAHQELVLHPHALREPWACGLLPRPRRPCITGLGITPTRRHHSMPAPRRHHSVQAPRRHHSVPAPPFCACAKATRSTGPDCCATKRECPCARAHWRATRSNGVPGRRVIGPIRREVSREPSI